MQFTLSEVMAIVGAMIASAGVATGVVKWLLDGRQEGFRRVHDRLESLGQALPKDYVPRQELNGRLSAIDTTMQHGFAAQHEAMLFLRSAIESMHVRVDQLLQGPIPRSRRGRR